MARFPSSSKKNEWVSRAWERGKVPPKVPRPIIPQDATVSSAQPHAKSQTAEPPAGSQSSYDSAGYSASDTSTGLAVALGCLAVAVACS